MSKKVLTPGNVQAIMRLRAQLDEWGQPKMTGTEIAIMLGVSESTVWRAIKQQAAYAKRVPPSAAEEQRSFDAALEVVRMSPPASEEEVQSSIAKMEAALQEKRKTSVDVMLEELSPELQDRAKTYLGKD